MLTASFLSSLDSIKAAAKTAAHGLVKFYTGNYTGDTPGNLPQPYYWWEAGAMFGGLIDYYYYTGDSQYNDITTQALLWQVGPNKDYMTPNQTKTEGNDDQGFWGMAAMSAAETKFPDPPADKPQWLALAQGVFNSQALRWDTQFCNGGLRWQIFTFNTGYDYKNTISNGAFFNLAARLARYTGNQTYADWADRTWEWSQAVGFIKMPEYYFYDGAHTTLNCTDINRIQWSYNPAVFLSGAAHMYNFVSNVSLYFLGWRLLISFQTNGEEKWKTRVQGILNGTSLFFSPTVPNVMYEVACEGPGTCNTDNKSFKAYLSRWMAATTKMAPFTYNAIMIRLRASASAAALQCSGGPDGQTCGLKWTEGAKYDGFTGVGEQMSAMEVFQSLLITKVDPPVTQVTGGTSQGDPSAGSGGTSGQPGLSPNAITKKDRVGAGILTVLVLIGAIGGVTWIVL